MNNQKQTFWTRRIPPFLSIFVLVLSLTTIVWLSGNTLLFGTKAAEGGAPKNIQISNITDTSFTISYTTDDAVVGLIKYRKDEPTPTGEEDEEEDKELDQIAFDDRDKTEGEPLPHRVHHITIPQLEPGKTYLYAITSGEEEFLDEDVPFEITTAITLQDTPAAIPPITGKVTLYDGAIPTEAIAYVSSETSQLRSVLLRPDGTYELPLTGIREKDLSKYQTIAADTKLKMLVINSSLQSNIALLAGQTSSPLPQTILPKDYDFALNAPSAPSPTPKDDSTAASYSATLTPPTFPTTNNASTSSSLTIIVPIQDQEFKDPQPKFEGSALPNAEVGIVINSGTGIQTSVEADANGSWEFRPSTPLEAGIHTITVGARDSQGTLQTVTRSFTIFASGSQFIEPSVKAVSPTLTAVPTAEPTSVPATPTTEPTATQSPTSATTPTGDSSTTGNNTNTTPAVTREPLPPTGNSSVVMGLTAIMISIFVGAILLFAL